MVILLSAQSGWIKQPEHYDYYETKRWESPDKKVSIFLSTNLTVRLQRDGEQPMKVKDAESDLSKEHLGLSWFRDAKRYKWTQGNHFLAFEKEDSLGVLDTAQAHFLINTHFQSIVKHPKEDKWVFVRYRGTYRHGGWESESFSDTLGLIELTLEALKPEKAAPLADTEGFADATFLDHCKWIKLDGLIVSPPIWNKDGSKIVFLQWINGKTYLCLHDGKSLKEDKRTEVQVSVPKEILESPALVDDLKSKVETLLK